MKLKKWIAAMALLAAGGMACAQATLADPLPLMGNQAESLAGTAAVNGAMGQSAGLVKTSPAEFERRKAQAAQATECRKTARAQHPAGSAARKAARLRCETTFKAQKASWYDKDRPLR